MELLFARETLHQVIMTKMTLIILMMILIIMMKILDFDQIILLLELFVDW